MKNIFRKRDRGLYRSRTGVIMGVCRGFADYFDFSVFWIRFFCILAFIFTGLWPMVGIYLIASFIMKPEPVNPIESEDEQDFYDNYVTSRKGAVRMLKRRFQSLERRLRRIEDTVTTKEFEWDRKFNT